MSQKTSACIFRSHNLQEQLSELAFHLQCPLGFYCNRAFHSIHFSNSVIDGGRHKPSTAVAKASKRSQEHACVQTMTRGQLSLHLGTDHRHGFALGRIYFAGHDAATRLILRQLQFSKPAPRTTPQKADIISNLHERDCNGVQSARSFHDGIMRC